MLVFGQPSETLDVVVGPPRGALVEHGGVVDPPGVPGGVVAVLEVLLHPGVATALAVVEDLVAQAAQGEQLVRLVGELADGVVELDLDALLVGLVDVGRLRVQIEERVVDVGVDLVGSMPIPIPAPTNSAID